MKFDGKLPETSDQDLSPTTPKQIRDWALSRVVGLNPTSLTSLQQTVRPSASHQHTYTHTYHYLDGQLDIKWTLNTFHSFSFTSFTTAHSPLHTVGLSERLSHTLIHNLLTHSGTLNGQLIPVKGSLWVIVYSCEFVIGEYWSYLIQWIFDMYMIKWYCELIYCDSLKVN